MKTAVLLVSVLLAFAMAQGCAPRNNPSSDQVTSPAPTVAPLVAATPEPRKLSAEEQTALSEFAGFAGTRVTPDKFQAHLKEVQAKASEYTTKFPLVGGDQWDFLVVQAAFSNGQYTDAITASDAFIAKYPGSAQLEQVMMLRGYSLFSTKQYDLAAQQYYAVTEQFPDSANLPLAIYNCGANYYMAQKMDEAVEMLEEELLARFPDCPWSPAAHQLLALIADADGDTPRAAMNLWAFLLNNQSYLAINNERNRKVGDLVEKLASAAQTAEDKMNCAAMRMLYYSKAYDTVARKLANPDAYSSSAEELGKLLEKSGNAPFAIGPAYVYTDFVLSQGDTKTAWPLIEKWSAVASGAYASKFFVLKLTAFLYDDRYEEVLKTIDAAPEELRMDPDALNFAAMAAMNLDKYDVAVKYCSLGLKVKPNDQNFAQTIKTCGLVGKIAPEIAGTNLLTGKDIKLSDLRGKVVLIDFWATWCGPCRGELPNVVAVYEKYGAKGFEILGVSLDQENMADAVKKFCEAQKMPWPQIYEGKYWNVTSRPAYKFNAIPFTVLVDKEGYVRKVNKRGEALDPAVAEMLGIK